MKIRRKDELFRYFLNFFSKISFKNRILLVLPTLPRLGLRQGVGRTRTEEHGVLLQRGAVRYIVTPGWAYFSRIDEIAKF